MTTREILHYLYTHEIAIRAELATIYVTPADKITPELAQGIKRNKPELLWLLAHRLEVDAGRPPYGIFLRERDWEWWQTHYHEFGEIEPEEDPAAAEAAAQKKKADFEAAHPVQTSRDRYGWRGLKGGSGVLTR